MIVIENVKNKIKEAVRIGGDKLIKKFYFKGVEIGDITKYKVGEHFQITVRPNEKNYHYLAEDEAKAEEIFFDELTKFVLEEHDPKWSFTHNAYKVTNDNEEVITNLFNNKNDKNETGI
jgi:hypothetical protein